MSETFTIGIIGASGAVGKEMLTSLDHTKFPLEDINLYANKTAGENISTPWGERVIQSGQDVTTIGRVNDIVLLATSGGHSLQISPELVTEGAFVIDNSSAWRMAEHVPLVVPEINGEVITNDTKLIANPNCTTAILAIPLHPIANKYGIEKVLISTYQAVSGAGKAGVDELFKQQQQFVAGKESILPEVFSHQIANNVIPRIDSIEANGFTKEEMKVVQETKKIFGSLAAKTGISCESVRIPTERAHAESIVIETSEPLTEDSIENIRKILSDTSGVIVMDEPENDIYPTPLVMSGKYDVGVGRLRIDPVFDREGKHYGLRMFICGDQLLRGAAYNAVLIAHQVKDILLDISK